MQLYKGLEAEYRKRNYALWPELEQLLKSNGINDYPIFWDESNNSLFSIMKVENLEVLTELLPILL